jgi:uncharacterized OB-fold protein
MTLDELMHQLTVAKSRGHKGDETVFIYKNYDRWEISMIDDTINGLVDINAVEVHCLMCDDVFHHDIDVCPHCNNEDKQQTVYLQKEK